MPESAIPRGTLLGIDFGIRRIGVAVGQATSRTASVLETIVCRSGVNWQALDRLVKEWQPQLFVIGLPLNAEGQETDMSRAARKFGQALRQRYDCPCEFSDERLTSRAAADHFVELRASGGLKRKHAARLDSMAAQIILQNWLQSLPIQPSSQEPE